MRYWNYTRLYSSQSSFCNRVSNLQAEPNTEDIVNFNFVSLKSLVVLIIWKKNTQKLWVFSFPVPCYSTTSTIFRSLLMKNCEIFLRMCINARHWTLKCDRKKLQLYMNSDHKNIYNNYIFVRRRISFQNSVI